MGRSNSTTPRKNTIKRKVCSVSVSPLVKKTLQTSLESNPAKK